MLNQLPERLLTPYYNYVVYMYNIGSTADIVVLFASTTFQTGKKGVKVIILFVM